MKAIKHDNVLLERDTHLKREKRSGLTGSVHVCAVVLLYGRNGLFLFKFLRMIFEPI